METGKGRICIIDDDEAVRESLRILLFSNGFQTTLFSSADEFLRESHKPDVDTYLLDIRMPGTDGMELHQELIRSGSRVPVIFITGHGDIPLAVAAIQKGAFDFLTKPFEDGELVEKIEKSVLFYRELQTELQSTNEIRERLGQLTPRETDVALLIVAGLANKQIAGKLDISPRTVEIHRARVMEKTTADSVAELVRMISAIDEINNFDN